MAENSAIAWCDHTINFWWGCHEVSPACANCYAREMDKMRGPLFDHGFTHWGKDGHRWIREKALSEVCKIAKRGFSRVFVNSMSDSFEDHPALVVPRRAMLEALEAHPGTVFMLLTKRPGNVVLMAPYHWLSKWPTNVWIGSTAENQEWAERRLESLTKIPAAVRFLSCEPLLGPLNLVSKSVQRGDHYKTILPTEWLEKIHWVISGGESGPKRRLMEVDWITGLADQCAAAEVPFFCKQDTALLPGTQGRLPDALFNRKEFPARS